VVAAGRTGRTADPVPQGAARRGRRRAFLAGLRHPLPRQLAQFVDRTQGAAVLEMPEAPAIAGVEILHGGAHAVDRAGLRADADRAVSAHAGAPAPIAVVQFHARLHEACLEEGKEGDARLAAADAETGEFAPAQRR